MQNMRNNVNVYDIKKIKKNNKHKSELIILIVQNFK